MLLSDKYSFLINYFQNLVNNPNRAMFQSIVFYGNDLNTQYEIALYIARMLNCTNDKSFDCSCRNCDWIRNNEHPAVLTISHIDNKPLDDTSKTVISVKQAQMVKQLLLTSSEYYRVFIFCDKDNNGNVTGLNSINFQEKTANGLLKTIEEPPKNTLFFFLAQEKEDLLSTILSRSQCFYVPNFERESENYNMIKDIIEEYFLLNRRDAFTISQNLSDISDDKIQILDEIQCYILSLMKCNYNNKPFLARLMSDIKAVENAKSQIKAKVSPVNVFDNLCLAIIKN